MTPVMNAAAGEARKRAAPAISAGWPQRPRGVRAMMARFAFGVGDERRGEGRFDPAGGDGVDADAVRGPGDGQRLGELHDAAFAGAIGRGIAAAEEARASRRC